METKAERILHIDDDPVVLLLTEKVLTTAGYEIDCKTHDQLGEAHSWAGYDLIIMDLIMPAINGFDLCRDARARGYSRAIMILSSKDLTADERRQMAEIDAIFMPKPFGPHELITRVRNMLGEQQ